jgi:hypothetical protein
LGGVIRTNAVLVCRYGIKEFCDFLQKWRSNDGLKTANFVRMKQKIQPILELFCELGVLGVIGMAEPRAGAGFIVPRLEARLHAGGGEPSDCAFFGVAHFGATSARGRFVAAAIAACGRNGFQAGGHVSVEKGRRQEHEGDERKDAEVETRDGGGKQPAHGPC